MSLYPFANPTSHVGEMLSELMPVSGTIDNSNREVSFNTFLRITFHSKSFQFQISNTDEKFAVNLNVSQFKPEELKINLEGRRLSIQGEHDVSNERGSSRQSFSRVILLPEDVDITSVDSNLSDNGHLVIEAPKLILPQRQRGAAIEENRHD
ncbi:hypothetical protein CRE_18317 [Caenorhabditis remanei]|uniref:SHSP domain-containing protein n=1 Tax=Caenorhabditis remanei TaxID=31234 RepID=E3NPQ5_CAERE|nr:hypothetical protein CRE_18317 [Caenorhabditis remanei]